MAQLVLFMQIRMVLREFGNAAFVDSLNFVLKFPILWIIDCHSEIVYFKRNDLSSSNTNMIKIKINL